MSHKFGGDSILEVRDLHVEFPTRAGPARLAGYDLLAMTAPEIRKARFSRISLVPQGAMNSLNPVLTVRAQIDDLLDAHPQKPNAKERALHVAGLLQRVGLATTVADQFAYQLSGGMKQRVCVAMAIALSPQRVVADEPTSARVSAVPPPDPNIDWGLVTEAQPA